jgi:hypothetical protein
MVIDLEEHPAVNRIVLSVDGKQFFFLRLAGRYVPASADIPPDKFFNASIHFGEKF